MQELSGIDERGYERTSRKGKRKTSPLGNLGYRSESEDESEEENYFRQGGCRYGVSWR